MTTFILYCKRLASSRRVYTGVLIILWLLTSYFLSMDYKTTLQRLRTRGFLGFRGLRNETATGLWILPRATLDNLPSGWRPPDNWTTLATPGGKNPRKSCPTCYDSAHMVSDLLHTWAKTAHRHPNLHTNSTSSRQATLTQLASAVVAIDQGAVNILTTSDLLSLNKSMSRLLLDNQPDGVRGIEYYGERPTVDSYHFLHRSRVVPDHPCKYRLRRRMNPLWTVGVRCKASTTADGETVLLDHRSPPVFSATPKLILSDFSDAFFDYEGLWAMFPSFLPPRSIESIVWGIWSQRLLQETGKEMAVTALACPTNVQPTMITTMKTMMTSESGKQAHAAFKFVKNWQCSAEKTLFECALVLAQSMHQAGLVKAEEIALLRIWLGELTKARYAAPRRVSVTYSGKDLLLGCIIHSPARVVLKSNSSQLQQQQQQQQQRQQQPENPFPHIYPFCKNLPRRQDVIDPFGNHSLVKPSGVADIALVIIFYDASIYANIQFLQDLYAKYFPHLIYCGPDFAKFHVAYRNLKTPISYIEVPDTKGFVAYECVSRAVMMNYDVSGYLEMADDVILNAWTLANIPRDRFWFQKDLRTASRHQQIMNDFALSYPFPWWPWTVHGQMWGAKAMAKVWKTFESIQTFNDTQSKRIVNSFLRTLRHNAGGSYDRFFYCSSDIFYVPAKFRQSWAMLSDIFFTNNVFLDIAVPTLMNGLELTANIVRMEGVYLWYNDRGNYPAYYRNHHQFFHPWKMGWIHRSDHANFLCFHVLPNIVGDLSGGQG